MKGGDGDRSSNSSTSRNGNRNVRSSADKEKTKLRERERRSITTKIFQGLRKHGGYRLSPRADINQVLRHLGQEAGWVIEPDGTTYRSDSSIINCNGIAVCPLCGNSSLMSIIGGGGDVANCIGGECSTTTSPRHTMTTIGDPIMKFNFDSRQATTQYPSSVISSSSTSAQGVNPYLQEARASNQNSLMVASPQPRI